MTGTFIAWFEARSYGFIRLDVSEEEVFAHKSDLVSGTPARGSKASFAVVEFSGRKKAVNIIVSPSQITPGVKS
jgi:cold shock CspA family protein